MSGPEFARPLSYDGGRQMIGGVTRYDASEWRSFRDDPVRAATVDDLAVLSRSPRWEDRVRAEVLRRHIEVTLPDGFPCLYERADSPTRQRVLNPQPSPWVVSPDVEMLQALLPDYQRLWDSHTSQWGPESRRVFAVGLMDGLSPSGMYVPGSTPDDVIVATCLTHGLRGRAPQDLRDRYDRHVERARS